MDEKLTKNEIVNILHNGFLDLGFVFVKIDTWKQLVAKEEELDKLKQESQDMTLIHKDDLLELQMDSALWNKREIPIKESDYDAVFNLLDSLDYELTSLTGGQVKQIVKSMNIIESHKSYLSTQYKGAKNG